MERQAHAGAWQPRQLECRRSGDCFDRERIGVRFGRSDDRREVVAPRVHVGDRHRGQLQEFASGAVPDLDPADRSTALAPAQETPGAAPRAETKIQHTCFVGRECARAIGADRQLPEIRDLDQTCERVPRLHRESAGAIRLTQQRRPIADQRDPTIGSRAKTTAGVRCGRRRGTILFGKHGGASQKSL